MLWPDITVQVSSHKAEPSAQPPLFPQIRSNFLWGGCAWGWYWGCGGSARRGWGCPVLGPRAWWPADICWEQSVFHHVLNLQSPDSTSHVAANQIFPPDLPLQAQTSGTSVGVVKNKCYLVNHARFQFFFCDVIMAPLLVLQNTQTTQRECSCSCNQCIYGWTTDQ